METARVQASHTLKSFIYFRFCFFISFSCLSQLPQNKTLSLSPKNGSAAQTTISLSTPSKQNSLSPPGKQEKRICCAKDALSLFFSLSLSNSLSLKKLSLNLSLNECFPKSGASALTS